MDSSAADVHWQYSSFVFGIPPVVTCELTTAVPIRLIFTVDNVMWSTVVCWTVTQILVSPVYIIATSEVSNHGLQTILTWPPHQACWLSRCLYLKISKSKSKFKFLTWRQCLHGWSLTDHRANVFDVKQNSVIRSLYMTFSGNQSERWWMLSVHEPRIHSIYLRAKTKLLACAGQMDTAPTNYCSTPLRKGNRTFYFDMDINQLELTTYKNVKIQ